jgi:hypothetical protein
MTEIADASAAQVERALTNARGLTSRKATVTSTSPFTISMNSVLVVSPPKSPRYYPVVNDTVLVLMDGPAPYVLDRISLGWYRYVPPVSYSGGGGNFGTSSVLEGEWDYDGARIVGQAYGQWGTGAAGGTGDFLIGCPVAGALSVGFLAGANPMVGSGFWYKASTGALAPVLVRMYDTTHFRLYRSGLETTAFPVTATSPWAPSVNDLFEFNFAYRPL